MPATTGDAKLAAYKFNVLSEPVMILLITDTERNETTGRTETIVSHGIDLNTGRTVVLPQERPEQLGASSIATSENTSFATTSTC